MSLIDLLRGRRAIAVVLFGALLAACSPAATSVAPSTPSPVATVAATPVPSVAGSASALPAPSASVATAPDPAIGLKIAAPYSLIALDPALEATIRQQITGSAGAFGNLIGVGGRTVSANGSPVGLVFVMSLPAGLMTDATYQSIVAGMASSSQVAFTTSTISGTEVSTGAGPTGSIGVFREGDHVVIEITQKATDLPLVAKALIDANK
ncbi:MAG: hypothetical protein ABI562_06565 [Chloroflexota bacterium]